MTRQGQVTADPNKPWRVSDTPATTNVVGVAAFVDGGTLGITYENPDGVRRGRQMALFAAANDGGNDLTKFDTITDGSDTWRIANAEVLKPADTAIIYMFEVER